METYPTYRLAQGQSDNFGTLISHCRIIYRIQEKSKGQVFA